MGASKQSQLEACEKAYRLNRIAKELSRIRSYQNYSGKADDVARLLAERKEIRRE